MIRLAATAVFCSVFILAQAQAAWDTGIVVDNPIAAEKAETAEICGSAITYTDDFTEEADLNGDGRLDIIVDHGGAECGGMFSFFCGSGGCSGGGYIARDDELIGALEGASTVVMSHEDGTLPDTFPLKGSRLAISEILATCR